MAEYDVEVNGQTVTIEANSPREAAARAYAQSLKGSGSTLTDKISSGYQAVRGAVTSGLNLLDLTPGARKAAGMPSPGEQYNPLPPSLGGALAQTTIGALPGGGGVLGAAGRVAAAGAAGGAGSALEGKPVAAGAFREALPVAAMEVAMPAASVIARSLPGMKNRIANAYTERLGQDVEEATGGVLAGLRTPAQLDAAVRGQQGAGGRLETGRRTLGDFYQARVGDANTAIGGAQVVVPTLGPQPLNLQQAVHDIQNIAAAQSAQNPAMRTVVGRPARELRQQAWQELEGELQRLDPSGAALAAVREGRQIFAIGTNFLDAVKKSGAITRGPNEVSFDSSKFQRYVSENRGQFINAFHNNGTPEAWQRFVQIVYRGGPVGTQDVLARTGTAGEAAQQLLRSGGGAGTTAVLPIRTGLPGLGSQYTGQAPFAVPPGGQTLADLLGLSFSDRLGINQERQ